MSDEEKKAIDYLKNDVVYWLDKGKDFVVIDIGENEKLHNILNLIDKQKKEIEELKQELINQGITDLKELNNYISKDKIRKKIEELSETQDFKVGLENYTIKILKELLEEK